MSSVASSTPDAARSASSSPVSPPAPSTRLVSLDALRGFDMFWILGGDAAMHAIGALSKAAPVQLVTDQFEHKAWAGFAFYDLIFPLFVFMVGASLVFSLTRTIEQQGRAVAVKRVIRRGVLLLLIGIVYSGGFSTLWPDIRLLGVLNRIALAYLGAGL